GDGLIAVDTLSAPRAERFLDHLRAPLGSLDAAPLEFDRPFGELLTRIFLGDAPRGFILGRECRMHDPADTKATVRCSDMDLAVECGNVLGCGRDHNGGIGKLKLLGADAAKDDADDDDPLAKLDAEVALLAGTLRELVAALAQALGGAGEKAHRAA